MTDTDWEAAWGMLRKIGEDMERVSLTPLIDALVEFREAAEEWARTFVDALLALDDWAKICEATGRRGRTWQDIATEARPRATRASVIPEPSVWRWHWNPKYGRR